MQPRTLAGELPAESVRLIPGEFFKGRFELRSTTPVASNCQVLLEKRPVVPLLLCCIVRWSTAKSDQTLHRRTGNAALRGPYIPGLNAGLYGPFGKATHADCNHRTAHACGRVLFWD